MKPPCAVRLRRPIGRLARSRRRRPAARAPTNSTTATTLIITSQVLDRAEPADRARVQVEQADREREHPDRAGHAGKPVGHVDRRGDQLAAGGDHLHQPVADADRVAGKRRHVHAGVDAEGAGRGMRDRHLGQRAAEQQRDAGDDDVGQDDGRARRRSPTGRWRETARCRWRRRAPSSPAARWRAGARAPARWRRQDRSAGGGHGGAECTSGGRLTGPRRAPADTHPEPRPDARRVPSPVPDPRPTRLRQQLLAGRAVARRRGGVRGVHRVVAQRRLAVGSLDRRGRAAAHRCLPPRSARTPTKSR